MQHENGAERKGSWKDWIWMALCCVPMIALIVLAALGFWGLR